jgi:hypothetical protein
MSVDLPKPDSPKHGQSGCKGGLSGLRLTNYHSYKVKPASAYHKL